MELIDTIKRIPVSYETNNMLVSFTVEFGKGKDAANCFSSRERTEYNIAYDTFSLCYVV